MARLDMNKAIEQSQQKKWRKKPRKRDLAKRAPLIDKTISASGGWSAYMGDTETVAKRLGQEDKLSRNMKERAAERRSKAIYMDSIDRHRAKLDQERLAKKHGELDDNSEEMANADDETRVRLAHQNAKVSGWGACCQASVGFPLLPVAPSVPCPCRDALIHVAAIFRLPRSPTVSRFLQLVSVYSPTPI